jgi:hypothetical protein
MSKGLVAQRQSSRHDEPNASGFDSRPALKKRCGLCKKKRKVPADFHVAGTRKDRTKKYQWACKRCWKKLASVRSKAHYYANKAYYIERNRRNKKRMLAFIRALKDNKCCTDCRKKFRFYVLHFDHVRGTKKYDVSRMLGMGSEKAILAEVAKCELVCANCHAERTYARLLKVMRQSRRQLAHAIRTRR